MDTMGLVGLMLFSNDPKAHARFYLHVFECAGAQVRYAEGPNDERVIVAGPKESRVTILFRQTHVDPRQMTAAFAGMVICVRDRQAMLELLESRFQILPAETAARAASFEAFDPMGYRMLFVDTTKVVDEPKGAPTFPGGTG